eukprot:51518-Prorocentrum_minimum.AAC.1
MCICLSSAASSFRSRSISSSACSRSTSCAPPPPHRAALSGDCALRSLVRTTARAAGPQWSSVATAPSIH